MGQGCQTTFFQVTDADIDRDDRDHDDCDDCDDHGGHNGVHDDCGDQGGHNGVHDDHNGDHNGVHDDHNGDHGGHNGGHADHYGGHDDHCGGHDDHYGGHDDHDGDNRDDRDLYDSFQCAAGVAYEKPCLRGQAYDYENHQCNYPDLVYDCKGQSESVVGFKCPTNKELPSNAVARR